ncbi:hypothetical protein [Pseudonocardia sp. ICBG601]|uniref:hypothetical protein n=1 Tax=Pseudonocardia sp. ICBG601 TaxID=2846759 RepID=UPI001CF658F5|nr:hypothetical protein [Pseudonocardia sp. ICBG601]
MVEALVCSDCATYWLAPATDGRRDLEAAAGDYLATGGLDSDLVDSGDGAAAGGAVSAAARAA